MERSADPATSATTEIALQEAVVRTQKVIEESQAEVARLQAEKEEVARQRDIAVASNLEFRGLIGSHEPSRPHAPEHDPDPRGAIANAIEASSRVSVDAFEPVD